MDPYSDIAGRFNGLLDEMNHISNKIFEMDPRTRKNSIDTLKTKIDQTARDLLALPAQERARRNLDAKHKRVQDDYATLQQLFQLATQPQEVKKAAPAVDVRAVASTEVGSRKATMEFFEDKLPKHNSGSHPKYQTVRRLFEDIARVYSSGRPVRGRNDCAYLSFGIGYLKHISNKMEKVQDLLACAAKHSPNGALKHHLQQYIKNPYDLEILAGNEQVMKDLVLVLRREVASYIRESFMEAENGNMIVVKDRMNPCHTELFANPKILAQWKAMGIEIPAEQLGTATFDETCKQISTPESRAAGSLEYDALSRRFSCPFVDLVFQSGTALRNVKDGSELEIRAYPLVGKGVAIPLASLANAKDNGTFALLAKDTGHSEVLFK